MASNMAKGFACFLFLCWAPLLWAGGFQTPLQGAKQAGMAHTGVANPLGAATLYFNPGALSLTSQNSISLQGFMMLRKQQFREQGTNQVYALKSGNMLPFAGYCTWNSTAKPWKLGLGIYTPFGNKADWGTDWAGRYLLTSSQLRVVHFQPTFSYSIKARVGIGAGFVYGRSNWQHTRSLPITLHSGLDGQARWNATGGGYGFNAGVLVRVSKKLDIGITYKSAIKYKLKGEAAFTVPVALADSFATTAINTTLQTPWMLDAGITLRPDPKLAISLDINYIGWSLYKGMALQYGQSPAGVVNENTARHYKNSVVMRLGGSFDVDSSFTIRAGTFLGLSPVANGSVSPDVADADRFGISLGGTLRSGERFELDLSLTYEEAVRRVEKQAENYASLGGTYKGRTIVVGVALNFNLNKKPKLPTENPVQP